MISNLYLVITVGLQMGEVCLW